MRCWAAVEHLFEHGSLDASFGHTTYPGNVKVMSRPPTS